MDNSSAAFSNDFKWAVVRLATLQRMPGQKGELLFATVTLLTPNRNPPTKMDKFDRHKIKKTNMTICYRRTILKAKDAIDWYRSLQFNAKTPIPSRQDDIEQDLDGIDIHITNLIDDPIWPNLGFPIGESLFKTRTRESDPVPFIGNSIARVHRRFGNLSNISEFFLDDSSIQFVARRLHISLKDYQEYLGSVCLIVPDPIIRKIDNFLIPATEQTGERIFYRFIPHVGQSLDQLKIAMFDEQAYLLSNFEIESIPADGILDIQKGNCSGTYGYIITHPTHGVLNYHAPTGFLRSMNFSMGIVSETRKVTVPISESPKSKSIEYSVNRVSRENTSTIGEESPLPNINVRVGISARQRQKVIDATLYDQRWFGKNTREEAMEFLRTRISKAKEKIVVADPYFGVLQIPQYLLAITNNQVQVTILTSKLAFEVSFNSEKDTERNSSDASLINKLKKFEKEINNFKLFGNAHFEVKVLHGKSPDLHDRFLVVDNEVWFLGNSLNTLGTRASMIIKLPNPDEVLEELDKMIEKSKDFSFYFQSKLKALETKK